MNADQASSPSAWKCKLDIIVRYHLENL